MSKKFLILDYETRSKADLEEVGAYEYSKHRSTRILCVAWKYGTREELRTGAPTRWWSPIKFDAGASESTRGSFGELLAGLRSDNTFLVAHNAFFEQVITRNVFGPKYMPSKPELREIPVSRWVCTASLARALALPGKLEKVCAALNLTNQKDMTGHRLMLKMSKPRKPTKNNPSIWHNSVSDLRRLIEYCVKDIDAETELFLTLPELDPMERKLWELDQKINFRGFKVDRELVKKILSMIEEETVALNLETSAITNNYLVSTAQRNAVMKWLKEYKGFTLPNLQAKTVSDTLLRTDLDPDVRRILEIRQAVSKTSTAKYVAFEARSRSDGRIRDHLVYHTASTGRWGGGGVQPQNFPRPNFSEPEIEIALSILNQCDLELIRLLYGDPMNVFSSCLRSMIIPSEGKRFRGGDYSAIEARVLFWVANHERGLELYRQNKDLYVEMAMRIYNILDPKTVTKKQRHVGKEAVLGCGYNLGWKRFYQERKKKGQEVDEELAKKAVTTYRTTHAPVVTLWNNLERAAIAATLHPGKQFTINHTTWWRDKKFLYCKLPSGRRLAYYGPEIQMKLTPWGESKPTLYHWGVDSLSKKWVKAGTYGGLLTENVVQAIARDVMAWRMLEVDAHYPVVLTVHDELLGEEDMPTKKKAPPFDLLMSTLPPWANGLPIKVEGWEGFRYRK